MLLKILLIISILIQGIASLYALRLIRTTKYNSIWILFIIGFLLLSVERIIELVDAIQNEGRLIWHDNIDGIFGVIISICLSVGVMYAHKLFKYIDRLNRHRQQVERRILTVVLRTEEKTRSHFSKEIHDGLGPLLSSAKMSLTALNKSENLSSEQQKMILQNTTQVIDEAIRSIREISNNLSPRLLNDFGLKYALESFTSKCALAPDVEIKLTTNLHSERFDTDVEVIIYRVICELINNSLKHSGCKKINLTITLDNSHLHIDYSDDGCGFSPLAMIDCGMGLSNISSRIDSINGRFDIKSEHGNGMHATIDLNTNKLS